MGNWLENLLPREAELASTAGLTDAFMAMDDVLARVQAMVADYRAVTADHSLDAAWNAVVAQCDDAISSYLALVSPGTEPTRKALEKGTHLLQCAREELNSFRDDNDQRLCAAAHEKIRREDADRQSRAAAAQRVARMADEASGAVASLVTRLEMARTRRGNVVPALSALLREFVGASYADLVNNEHLADDLLAKADDQLGHARQSLRDGDPEGGLVMARSARAALSEADRLVDAVPARLAALRAIRDDPGARAEAVHFALRDARMYCVDHGLVEKYAAALDSAADRIRRLEAGLSAIHPNYWAYANGLDSVKDFVQSVVARMREDVRR